MSHFLPLLLIFGILGGLGGIYGASLSIGTCYYPEQHSLCQKDKLQSTLKAHIQTLHSLNISTVRIFEFAWGLMHGDQAQWPCLDEIVDTLNASDIRIVMGTPTATPPRFIVNEVYDELLPVTEQNQLRKFGSRRHYSFASEVYKQKYVAGIVKEMAQRYGSMVSLWQIDNELGDHDTLRTYDPQSKSQFQVWLKQKYSNDIAKLNQLWGNVFWSMQYERFEDVELPNQVVAQANPIHWLEFYRFSSDQAVKFHQHQVNVLRSTLPHARVTSNYLGWDDRLNHYNLGAHQDIFSWDSYPLGILDVIPVIFSPEEKRRYHATGHPDFAAWNHDHVACSDPARGRQPFIVMEQQPGPVNWAKNNPSPAPGMLFLWAMEAFAHSADQVAFFRLQQFAYAQEQFHSGILLSNGEPDEAYFEIRDKIMPAIRKLNEHDLTIKQGDVALVFHYDSAYAISILPQGENFRHMHLVFIFYKALRSLGLNIDIIDARADFTGYKMVVFPSVVMPSEELSKKLESFKGHVIYGPRSGSKTEFFSIPPNLAPGRLQQFVDFTVRRVSSLPEGVEFKVEVADRVWEGEQNEELSVETTLGKYWRETLHVKPGSKAQIVGTYADTKTPAIVAQGNHLYIGFWPEEQLIRSLVRSAIPTPLAENASHGLRIRKRGTLYFALNYEDVVVRLRRVEGCEMRFVVGGEEVEAHGVSVFRLLGCDL